MANIRIRDQGKITLKDSDNSNEVSLQSPSTLLFLMLMVQQIILLQQMLQAHYLLQI